MLAVSSQSAIGRLRRTADKQRSTASSSAYDRNVSSANYHSW
jgi:hypothetical protein